MVGTAIRAIVRLSLMPTVAAAAVAWTVIGPLSEEGGDEQVLSLPLAEDDRLAIGVGGLLLGVVVAADVSANWRRRARWGGVVGWSVAMGTWLGVLGAVLAARTSGANIGAGLMLMASIVVVPVVAVVIATKVRAVAAPVPSDDVTAERSASG